MTDKLLVEKTQTAKLAIDKKTGGRKIKPLRVVGQLDISGSMAGMFRDGTVQNAFDQLLGAALLLDDDGNLDFFTFDDRSQKIASATEKDYGVFVQKHGLGPRGGTSYAPAIRLVHESMFDASPVAAAAQKAKSVLGGLFGAKPQPTPPVSSGGSQEPVLAFFITDGDSMNEADADRALGESASFPIYWNLVGIGRGSSFNFLKRMADKYDNVGFVDMPEGRVSDDVMYDRLFTSEFIEWTNKL